MRIQIRNGSQSITHSLPNEIGETRLYPNYQQAISSFIVRLSGQPHTTGFSTLRDTREFIQSTIAVTREINARNAVLVNSLRDKRVIARRFALKTRYRSFVSRFVDMKLTENQETVNRIITLRGQLDELNDQFHMNLSTFLTQTLSPQKTNFLRESDVVMSKIINATNGKFEVRTSYPIDDVSVMPYYTSAIIFDEVSPGHIGETLNPINKWFEPLRALGCRMCHRPGERGIDIRIPTVYLDLDRSYI